MSIKKSLHQLARRIVPIISSVELANTIMPMPLQTVWGKHQVGVFPAVVRFLEDERVEPQDIELGPRRRAAHQVIQTNPVKLCNPFPALFQGVSMIRERETAHELVFWCQRHYLTH
jgi:hypothetical protein